MSDKLNWTVDIPEKSKFVIEWRADTLEDVVTEGDKSGAENRTTEHSSSFRIAQITDIHFDPYFSPGTRTDCGEPVCCRNVNGPARTLASMAGIWGDYTDCDTPYFTVDNALKRVSAEHPDVSVTVRRDSTILRFDYLMSRSMGPAFYYIPFCSVLSILFRF